VRLTRNISVELGLFNGAMGTVYGFVYKGPGPLTPEERVPKCFSILEDDEREIPIILVRMDGIDDPLDNTKSTFPYSCSNTVTRLVPITAMVGIGKIKSEYHRVQVPILPAHARTAHSLQGYTANDGVVVESGSSFFAGDYVAISRAKCLAQVILLRPALEAYFKSHNDYRKKVKDEYARLANVFGVVM
jgi:hypothetical protein